MDQISNGEKFTTRAIQICLLLLALSAPISIAATQTAWALCILFWLIRLIFVRPEIRLANFDLVVLAFIGLTLVSSIFSYEPQVSLRKMVSVSLVSIVYLVATNIKDKTMLYRILVLLLAGCFIACLYTFAALAVGSNLKILKLTADSPLREAGIMENDTILTARENSIQSPDDLSRVFAEYPDVPIRVYRHELINTYRVPDSRRIGATHYNAEYFGIVDWSRGRDARAAGFFGHYTTFAEALQLLASLALALLIIAPGGLLTRNRVLLAVVLVSAIAALFLSLTRASWLSFVISATIIMLSAASRRTILIFAALAIPIIIGGLIFLQQKRQVSFIDAKDDSTTWRTMVWRESFGVLTSSPQHMAFGVGMDSLKTHYLDWKMFDNGRQPIGHLHNDYLQIAFERGLPTLIAWLLWMCLFLWLLLNRIIVFGKFRQKKFDWPAHGLIVGAFGGTIGFLTSGLVHYNWGDSEVVMIFYLIMGLSLAVINNAEARTSVRA